MSWHIIKHNVGAARGPLDAIFSFATLRNIHPMSMLFRLNIYIILTILTYMLFFSKVWGTGGIFCSIYEYRIPSLLIISSLLAYKKYYYDDSDVNDEIDNIWCGVHTVDNNYSSSLNFLQVGAKPSNLSLAFYTIIITICTILDHSRLFFYFFIVRERQKCFYWGSQWTQTF